MDITQSSSPSHVQYGDLLAAAMIIQQECVEKDLPPWGGRGYNMGKASNDATLRSEVATPH